MNPVDPGGNSPSPEQAVANATAENGADSFTGYAIHIHHLERATGIEDWYRLMQTPDRLEVLLRLASPIGVGVPHLLEGGPFTWGELLCNIVGIGSDLWVMPTEHELAVRQQLAELCMEWLGFGLWNEPEGAHARQLRALITLLTVSY